MKYPILAGVLTLALGSRFALADDPASTSSAMPPQQEQQPQQPQTSTTPATTPGQPGFATTTQTENLYFDTSSAAVNDDAAAQDKLKAIAKFAKCHCKSSIILQGHADPRGTAAYNADLSLRRAVAVRDQLIGMGVRPSQLVIESFGKTQAKGNPLSADRRVTAKIEATGVTSTGNLSG